MQLHNRLILYSTQDKIDINDAKAVIAIVYKYTVSEKKLTLSKPYGETISTYNIAEQLIRNTPKKLRIRFFVL